MKVQHLSLCNLGIYTKVWLQIVMLDKTCLIAIGSKTVALFGNPSLGYVQSEIIG